MGQIDESSSRPVNRVATYSALIKVKLGEPLREPDSGAGEIEGYFQSFSVSAASIQSVVTQVADTIDSNDEIEEMEVRKENAESQTSLEEVIDRTGKAFYEAEQPSAGGGLFSRIFKSFNNNA